MSRKAYLTQQLKDDMVRLYKTGVTMQEVADKFGVCITSVSRACKAAGYDRTHVGGSVTKSNPVVNIEPPKRRFTVTSRTVKLHSNDTGFSYTVSTDSEIIEIEGDTALMTVPVASIDTFILELQNIKSMLHKPS